MYDRAAGQNKPGVVYLPDAFPLVSHTYSIHRCAISTNLNIMHNYMRPFANNIKSNMRMGISRKGSSEIRCDPLLPEWPFSACWLKCHWKSVWEIRVDRKWWRKICSLNEISVSKSGDLGPLGAKQGKHIASGLPDLLSHGNHGVDTYLDTWISS